MDEKERAVVREGDVKEARNEDVVERHRLLVATDKLRDTSMLMRVSLRDGFALSKFPLIPKVRSPNGFPELERARNQLGRFVQFGPG